MHRFLAIAVSILQYLCTGTTASNGPYLLLAFRGRIDAMDMNGNLLDLTITDGPNRIEAVDCNYRTQQVYWISHTGHIKRANINSTQQGVQIIASDFGARDLAVDWLEDVLYWTNVEEDKNKIRRLNLASTDFPATSLEKIPVQGIGNGSTLRGIVLNPMIRSMYVMDVGLNQLMEIDYTGNVIRNIFSEPRPASCPALSLPHNSIFWYEVPSTIGVKKLSQSLSFFHTLSGDHVGGIQYYGGKIYWTQRPGFVYCKTWNDTQSGITRLRDYQMDVINDMALMSNPFTSDNYTGYMLPAPTSSIHSAVTVTPPMYTSRHTTVSTQHEDVRKTSTAVSMKTIHTHLHTGLVVSNGVTQTANSVGVATTRRPQSSAEYNEKTTYLTHKLQPTPLSDIPVQQTSRIQAQTSHSYSELQSATKSITANELTSIKTPAPLTSVQSSNTADSTSINRLTASGSPSRLSSSSTKSPTPTFSAVQKPTSSLDATPAATSTTLFVSHTSLTDIPVHSALISATPTSTGHESTASTTSQPIPIVGGGQIAAVAATPPIVVGSHDSHMTSTYQSHSLLLVVPTSSRHEIQPSSVVVVNEGNNYNTKQISSQLEAVVITISCLGAAVLLFVGLAILDAIYYFSYERRSGKKGTSGILGGVWKMITRPLYCLLCPRFIFRRQRQKRRYPYVPRRMDISDVSMYSTDAGHTTTTSLSTTTTDQTSLPISTHGSGIPLMDRSGSQNADHSGTLTDHGQPNPEFADFTIVSSNEGHSDSISGYSNSDAAASVDIDYTDYQGQPPPSAQVKRLELETKIALGVAVDYDDIDDDEIEKNDLSLQ